MALDNMPGDPMMLLSFVNTRLRDDKISLYELCGQFDVSQEEIMEKLAAVGYEYNEELNRFI